VYVKRGGGRGGWWRQMARQTDVSVVTYTTPYYRLKYCKLDTHRRGGGVPIYISRGGRGTTRSYNSYYYNTIIRIEHTYDTAAAMFLYS